MADEVPNPTTTPTPTPPVSTPPAGGTPATPPPKPEPLAGKFSPDAKGIADFSASLTAIAEKRGLGKINLGTLTEDQARAMVPIYNQFAGDLSKPLNPITPDAPVQAAPPVVFSMREAIEKVGIESLSKSFAAIEMGKDPEKADAEAFASVFKNVSNEEWGTQGLKLVYMGNKYERAQAQTAARAAAGSKAAEIEAFGKTIPGWDQRFNGADPAQIGPAFAEAELAYLRKSAGIPSVIAAGGNSGNVASGVQPFTTGIEIINSQREVEKRLGPGKAMLDPSYKARFHATPAKVKAEAQRPH
jgi:hypothetical protein